MDAAIEWYKGAVHVPINVYLEMLLQIQQDYSCLPPVDQLTLSDILTYYDGRRGALKSATKPRDG